MIQLTRQGFYQPREVGSLQTQNLCGGGAVSLGLGERFRNQFPSIVIDSAVIRQATAQYLGRRRNNFCWAGREAVNSGPCPRTTALSMTLASSRTLPGHA